MRASSGRLAACERPFGAEERFGAERHSEVWEALDRVARDGTVYRPGRLRRPSPHAHCQAGVEGVRWTWRRSETTALLACRRAMMCGLIVAGGSWRRAVGAVD